MKADKRGLKMNLIFAAVLLALAGGVLLWRLYSARPGVVALLEYGPGQTMEIPLDRDARYDLESGGYTIHLEVADGRIRFTDSPCPDHLCEGYGWLSREGDFAACLPARAVLNILDAD